MTKTMCKTDMMLADRSVQRRLERAKRVTEEDEEKMLREDAADLKRVCGLLKRGRFIKAADMWDDMDTEAREEFPQRLINSMFRLANAEWDASVK